MSQRYVILLLAMLILVLQGSVRSADAPAATTPPKPVSFSFAVVADMHVGVPDADKRLARIIQVINASGVKFVVFDGDFVTSPSENNLTTFTNIIAGLKVPRYIVEGNHDIWPKNVDDMIKRFGPLYDKLEINGVVMLFVSTEPLYWEQGGADVFKWLESAMNEAGDKPVLIFTHRTLEDMSAENRKQWLALLNGHNVKAMFVGHLHQDYLIWEDGFPEFVVPAHDPPGGSFIFRAYQYNNGRIGYRTEYLRLLPEQTTPPVTTEKASKGAGTE